MSETGLEHLPPDGYLQPRRFRVSYECERCGHAWTKITTKLSGKDPACPIRACHEAAIEEEVQARAERIAKMLLEQRAPGHIGENVIVKAVDETARIVMEDHHMTNLQDNIRVGDAVRPKLPPAQQKLADGFFGGEAMKDRVGPRQARAMDLLGRRAIAGAFRSSAINPSVLVPGQTGEQILRPVTQEKLR